MKTDITHPRLRLVARFILAISLIAFVTLSTAHALGKWIFKPPFKPPAEKQYGISPVNRQFLPVLFLP